MRVLMFGWEFPPHISGGLGTACHGLTQSLIKEGIEILFVVPLAHGDEEIKLINASEIPVTTPRTMISSSKKEETSDQTFEKLNIRSSLTPYSWEISNDLIPHWSDEHSQEKGKEVETEKTKRYAFSGKYGPALLEEVMRYKEVATEIARNSFDLIHAHDWLTYPAGMEAKRVSGKPLVVHVHATEYDRAGEKNIDHRVVEIERAGMEAADQIIAVSQWTKKIIVDNYGIEPEKVKVVHNGIIPDGGTEFPFLPKIGKHIVTFLGRITFQKGPQYFAEAARRVIDYFPDTHFVMAGSGDLLPAMMELVAHYNISSRFHFTGFLKGVKIKQLWSVSDVFVMPSVSEPFGITPLEAAQAGVPVIVSNQSGVAEVMDHVIKVDFWKTDALANAIVNVLKHRALSESLKREGSRQVKNLTWQRSAKKINTLYHELLPTH